MQVGMGREARTGVDGVPVPEHLTLSVSSAEADTREATLTEILQEEEEEPPMSIPPMLVADEVAAAAAVVVLGAIDIVMVPIPDIAILNDRARVTCGMATLLAARDFSGSGTQMPLFGRGWMSWSPVSAGEEGQGLEKRV